MAVTYLRLFPAVNQFELRNGMLNVAGRLYVYYQGTDDLADIYDENGTQLQQPAILDSDGRAPGLFVDSARVYWLKVCDRYDDQQYTVEKMVPSGGGGGSSIGGADVSIISTDGSIVVDESMSSDTKTFDLSVAEDATENLEWSKVSGTGSITEDGPLALQYQAGSMTVVNGKLRLEDDQFYHITTHFDVVPDAQGNTYDTLTFTLYKVNDDNETGLLRTFVKDVDSSLTDPIVVEYSTDILTEEAVLVYWTVEGIADGISVGLADMYAHRVYSGIPRLPENEYASQEWVTENFQSLSGMSAYQTTAGMSAYATKGELSTKLDASASSQFALSSSLADYQKTADMTAFLPVSASSSLFTGVDSDTSLTGIGTSASPLGVNTAILEGYQPTSSMSAYATTDDLSGYLPVSASSELFTGASTDTSLTGIGTSGSPLGVNTAILSDYQPTSSMSAYQETSGMTAYLPVSASSELFTGASTDTSLTGIGTSASPLGVNTAILSDYQQTADMTAYQTTADMTGYLPVSATSELFTGITHDTSLTGSGTSASPLGANSMRLEFDSATMYTAMSGDTAIAGVNTSILSSYQPTSSMGNYATTGDLAAKADTSSLSAYQPTSAMSAYQETSGMTAYLPVSASSSLFTGVVTDTSMTGDGLSSNPLGVKTREILWDSATMTTSESGTSAKIGVNPSLFDGFQPTSSMSAYATTDSLSAYATTDSLSAYATTGDLADKLDASASSQFAQSSSLADYQPTSSMSSYATTDSLSAYATTGDLSNKLDASASSQFAQSSSLADYQQTADMSSYATTDSLSAYATTDSLSAKLDASASSQFAQSSSLADYQQTADMSAYATTDSLSAYATTDSLSAKLDASASSQFAQSSSLSNYQPTSSMSAYATTADLTAKLDSSAQVVTAMTYAGTYVSGLNGDKIQAKFASNAGVATYDENYDPLTAKLNASAQVVTAVNTNTASLVTGINGVAIAAGSTYSAGTYVEITGDTINVTGLQPSGSYASSTDLSAYLPWSAIDYTKTTAGTRLSASGTGSSTNLISAYNKSAGVSMMVSNTARLRLWDSAATANIYASSVNAWNDTTDLVANQSSSWSTNADWEQTATSSPAYIENKPDLVDIVAGPGIVVDNPDGNTLRVSTIDTETVLYNGSTSGTSGDVTLSEVITNFERIGIFYSMNHAYLNGNYNFGGKWVYLDPADLSITKKFNINDFFCDGTASNTMVIRSDVYTVSNDLTKFVHDIATQMFFNGTWAVSTTQHAIMYKVVGVHRIANN